MMRIWRSILVVAVALGVASCSGCSDLGYYLQCAEGHMEVLSKRRPIDEVIRDPQTPPELRDKLQTALDIRRFASEALGLPDNDSYRSYADIGRPYVVWNVVATPEFSLQPVTWCFPVAGCVPYRGYYRQELAEEFASGLRDQGYDTWVYGVPAYSTLNWFSDPLLSTFSHKPDVVLAGLVFHELAHQQVYLPGASDFNEAFAETIEQEGVLRWLTSRGEERQVAGYLQHLQREEDFVALAQATRGRLTELYQRTLPPEEMRQEKSVILERFRQELRDYQAAHQGYTGFNRWLQADLNNARFASLSTYRRLVPSFLALLHLKDDDLSRFYAEVQRIVELEPEERERVLAHLGTIRTAQGPETPASF